MVEVNKKVQDKIEDLQQDEDFASMLEEFSKEKEVAKGKIVSIKDNEVFVDINEKAEGILNIDEILDKNGNLLFNVGDDIRVVIVARSGGRARLSYRKAIRKEKVEEFIKNFDDSKDNIFEVSIIEIAKRKDKNRKSITTGYICQNDDGVEFFMPRSQSALRDSDSLKGKNFKVKVIKVNKDDNTIIVSRKRLIDEEKRARKEQINKILEQNEPVEGIVKKITTYGMFVDIGNIDGLVHYSEISYKGPINPSSLYKEGDKILVKVIEYDNKKEHLSLSIKAAMPDPWEEIKDSLEVGDTIEVIVSNIEPYGAFVDLGNDIEGFLHISEISWDKNIKNPKDFIKEGEKLNVEVIEINPSERRLRVSLKKLLTKPFDEFKSKYKVGDVVKGVITSITSFGAFVKIGNSEGLLHNEDISWDRKKCKDMFKVGDEVEVKITKIDTQDEKISLSIKELQNSPVSEFAKTHKIGDAIKGKVRDIRDFGIFVELSKDVDALIRKEDINDSDLEKLKSGDEIEAVIVFIDEKKNRIRLSVKRLAKQKEREVLNEINDNEKITIGDLIKDQLS